MKRSIMLLACLGLLIRPAEASTMPRADLGGKDARYFGIGVGTGLSVSVDVPVIPKMTLGGSLGTGWWGGADAQLYDLRMVYGFVEGGRKDLSIAGILGIWGASRFASFAGLAPGLEVGFGLAYPITHLLTVRLNLLVPYYGFAGGGVYDFFGGPAGGLELAYKFRPFLEGTAGFNGHGNGLGLKLNF